MGKCSTKIESAGQQTVRDFNKMREFVFPFDHRTGVGLPALNKINIGIKNSLNCLHLGQGFDTEIERAVHPQPIIAQESQKLLSRGNQNPDRNFLCKASHCREPAAHFIGGHRT